ncbi:hypothetical protein EJ072_08385 [Mesorhizobium sp. M2A.F.Ca.ET.046.03.2.1]|nr:hypothetical protein EJ072_08385 [Mesorhizobium sp. M2A.F.Ca.ET.046.03.2.1]
MEASGHCNIFLAVAGCTTVAPRFEPAPTAKQPTKQVRVTTTPTVVKQKKATARKPIKPVTSEPAPVIAPLGGGGGGGGGGW